MTFFVQAAYRAKQINALDWAKVQGASVIEVASDELFLSNFTSIFLVINT